MSELPSGTVTFLFTDIEGSTRLLHTLGRDRYDDVLTTHRELLVSAFEAHGGRVVDTQGDSFFVAFRTAADGVEAAVDAQRELAAHAWLEGSEVKVRMGLHTGEPKVGADRYVGVGVHKAARIGAAGHGGQVLLSSTTKELAEEELPAGVSIRDLGERRLKDLERPERIFQLVIQGLESEFAQLKTLDVELRRKRRRMYAGSALIGVVAAAVAIPVFALGQGSSGGGQTVRGNAVAVIDPGSNRVVGGVPVGAQPDAIAFGAGGLWVANLDDATISHVDPTTSQAVRAIPTGDAVSGLAAEDKAIWAVSADPVKPYAVLRRIDPRFDVLTKSVRVQAGAQLASGGLAEPATVAVGPGGVWVGTDSGLLQRVDRSTGAIAKTVDTGNSPVAIVDGSDAVWVADPYADNVVRVDHATSLVSATIPVGNGPSAIAIGAGAIWVADRGDDSVVRIDPATNAVTATIDVGRSPGGIAVGEDAVWVANTRDGTVSRIDAQTSQVTKTIRVGGSPQRIAVGGGRVWVTVQPVLAAEPGTAGGVLRIDSESPVDFLDPALAYSPGSWSLEYATCAKLLSYPDRPAPAGSQLEPEVAAALPARSAGGKTYTFTIRSGFRFSPPSNESVTAQTFKYTIERTLSPRIQSPARQYSGDIVGATAYEAGKAKHISGVTAKGNRLTIRLIQPAPDFLTRIALPFFCAVPLGTPVDPKGVRTIPGAGPYYVASYTPGQSAVVKRNPNYHGSRPHHLEEIDYTFGVGQAQSVKEIEAGQADFAADGVPPQAVGQLARKYGPKSPAAKAGHQQYFVNPGLETTYLALNASRPLFSDAKLRRAVNYALDRRALARVPLFGAFSPQPTDQLLPPNMPGFRDVHVYPFTPDLAKARRLAHGHGGRAVLYICSNPQCSQAAQIIQANLKEIGIDVEPKFFPIGAMFERLGRKGEPFDIGLGGWAADYPDPSDFMKLVYGPLIAATGNIGYSYFDDPSYNRKIAAAARLTGPRRYLAYSALDADLARNAAPIAALSNGSEQDFFSARMGCQTYQPVYGIDLAALCIRRR
jgi:YVTN family beta-propeller protein